MTASLRTSPRHPAPAHRPWVQPFDGAAPRRLNLMMVGGLLDAALPCRVPPARDVDVVVATGGLTDSTLGTLRHLRSAFPRPLPIVLVLGPSELGEGGREVARGQPGKWAAAHGITLLEDDEAVIHGVRFVGGTLWTDFRLHGRDDATVDAALEAAGPTFDRLDIRRDGRPLTPMASAGLHWRSRSWLGLALPGDLPTVVVTHHAPTGAGLPSCPFIDPLAASRASRCDDLVRQSRAALWIHGGRDAVDHVVGRIRVISRPGPCTLSAMVSIDLGGGVAPDPSGGPVPEPEVRRRPWHRRAATPARPTALTSLTTGDLTAATGAGIMRAPATPPSTEPSAPLSDPEQAARVLDGLDGYRVLRRLRPRPVETGYRLRPGESVALLVDVETTGLDHRVHEVIEVGMVAFVHDGDGRIGPVVGVFGALRQPHGEIVPEITRLTGITPGMVAGQTIDMDAVRALVDRADLVIAHNARFDRAFCERLDDRFRHKAWACSVAEVPWRELGFDGAKLGYLVNGCGLFHNGHRAVDDCHALLEVLAHESGGATALSHLLRSSRSTRVRVWAERAPFDRKDVLKARGYRWNDGGGGGPKAWWTEVDEADLASELGFLEREVHLRAAGLRRDVLTARERHRPT